jgi:ABC-2 type transport system ATP-binding protein
MLLGVLTPTAGRVTVLGEEMPKERRRVLPRINFTSPYVDLPKRLTVGENLAVFADLYGVRRARERIAAVAEDCDLLALLKRPYGTLSAGQRTRVSLAKAVINEPDVLLLDEPTASLDPDIGDRMRTYLEGYQRRTGCTMLLASHHMGEVERMCDDVIMLREGRVVDQGSPPALIARYGRANMEEVFLDIARGRLGEPMAGSGAEEITTLG